MTRMNISLQGHLINLHYIKAKVTDSVFIHFTTVNCDDDIVDISIPFSSSEIANFTKEDWIAIQDFVIRDREKMIAFAVKKENERLQAESDAFHQEMEIKPEIIRESPGYVYLLLSDTGHYKIGKSKDISRRILQLQTGLPINLQLIGSFHSNYYSKAERHVQNYFEEKHIKGEWFDLSKSDVETFLAIKDDELDYLFTF